MNWKTAAKPNTLCALIDVIELMIKAAHLTIYMRTIVIFPFVIQPCVTH